MFIKAKEIMEILDVGKTTAYCIINELNNSLQKKGYRTLSGKTSRKYFFETYYLER